MGEICSLNKMVIKVIMKEYKMCNLILSFLFAFIIMGAIFGTGQILYSFLNKFKVTNKLSRYSIQIISLFCYILMNIFMKVNMTVLKLQGLLNIKYWIWTIIVVFIVSYISSIKKRELAKLKKQEKLRSILSGMAMEIPQRLFMQVFLYAFIKSVGISVLFNSLIWCLGIWIQSLIISQKFNKELFIEVVASFIFSIGIGFIFMKSECIIFAVLGHGLERYLSEFLGDIRYKKVV